MRQTRRGFTLIELLIVVVIIGILAAIAIPKFANTKSKAYVTAMKSDLRNLTTAEEAFFADSARYGTATELTSGTTPRFRLSTGDTSLTITPGSGYWSATVQNVNLQSPTVVNCGVGVNTTNPVLSTAGDGEPVCK